MDRSSTLGGHHGITQCRREDGWTIARLATHFRVNRSTVFRWIQRDQPDDHSTAPKRHGRIVITKVYWAAVLAYRDANPHHGTQHIAHELHPQFPTANKATIWRILHAAGRIGPRPKNIAWLMPIGWH
ncbi:MAG TPA: helix-turn-helix domain-containing protein [Herpetosiphon sp.]|uniref:Uncharacterized protein n=1 Tax=Herpetosiphon aurantiacus (strain ATCC 23779 / DSM 785 / 114-95) TaxID=316274 RepID=A9B7A1_HERA2|nr:helix-turn-helix domain-containing protein [Herpetosiphon sp.]ABX06384.1 conserved hypothetical protein [Herpetosiphon aurantiacus DSM 785]HBW49818.1 helix-turn-helix domain-containing protein [Herpetosiphon sp.]